MPAAERVNVGRPSHLDGRSAMFSNVGTLLIYAPVLAVASTFQMQCTSELWSKRLAAPCNSKCKATTETDEQKEKQKHLARGAFRASIVGIYNYVPVLKLGGKYRQPCHISKKAQQCANAET